MMQDDDFYAMLPSNANTNLFPTNSTSFYRVALPRQIHLKDEEDWEVGLHNVIYPFSWFEVPHECNHPHFMLQRSGTKEANRVTLPVGRYRSALDVVEGMLQCMQPQSLHIAVDDEWNITFTTQDEWMFVAKPVAQALGWITHENKIRQSDLFGLKIYSTLDDIPTYGYEWCALPLRYSFTFPGTFLIPLTVSLCRCTHRVVQVQTNLIEPYQVGEEQLHLLHEMVAHGMFRDTIIEEAKHISYFPLRTKTFQTIEIYLTSACGQLLSFQGRIVNVTLHFRRRTR